jgi:hypothetical protein
MLFVLCHYVICYPATNNKYKGTKSPEPKTFLNVYPQSEQQESNPDISNACCIAVKMMPLAQWTNEMASGYQIMQVSSENIFL